MGKAKPYGRKVKLLKEHLHTYNPPFWAAIKKFGRPVHPLRLARKKRHWRRHSTWIH